MKSVADNVPKTDEIHDAVSIGGGVTVAALSDPANAQCRLAQMYAAEKVWSRTSLLLTYGYQSRFKAVFRLLVRNWIMLLHR